MKLIVGLGNPGSKYENTRHNVGFLAIDEIAKKYQIQVNKLKCKAQTGELRLSDKVILAKPQTFMNNSGEAVRELVDYYNVDLKDLIIIYDDIDIPFSTIRVKGKGSSGSHNGMRSIVKHLGDDKFPRVRISISQKPDYMDLADFVLSKFTNKEVPIVKKEIQAAAEASLEIVEKGVDSAMNIYNGMTFDD